MLFVNRFYSTYCVLSSAYKVREPKLGWVERKWLPESKRMGWANDAGHCPKEASVPLRMVQCRPDVRKEQSAFVPATQIWPDRYCRWAWSSLRQGKTIPIPVLHCLALWKVRRTWAVPCKELRGEPGCCSWTWLYISDSVYLHCDPALSFLNSNNNRLTGLL